MEEKTQQEQKAWTVNRIYTYKNPFELETIPEWHELKAYPHLCVSQTLVEGLKEYYGRSAFQLLCTVDGVLKKFYEDWHDSPENNIDQFRLVDGLVHKWEQAPSKNKKLVQTIKHNMQDFIKSLRMLIESDVSPTPESISTLTEEQQLLMEAYSILRKHKAFRVLNFKHTKLQLDYAYVEVLRDEAAKYIKHYTGKIDQLSHRQLIRELEKAKDLLAADIYKCSEWLRNHPVTTTQEEQDKKKEMEKRYERGNKKNSTIAQVKSVLEKYKDYERLPIQTDKVVLHGIHQFTPLMLRFIKELNELGVEVIAMFNYMSEYPEIYKTWKRVYEWTDTEPIHRGNDYREKRQLGEVMGKIYERDFSAIDTFQEKYYVFDHLTSFSDYVGDRYQEASDEYEKLFEKKEKENDKVYKQSADNEKLIKIALMKEQFYAINGSEINELLKVYFPEQFSSRHFLTYPLGQFILSLYSMWKDAAENVDIHPDQIKEALALDIWREEGMPTPLDMFHNLAMYFKKANTFGDYIIAVRKLKSVANKSKDPRTARMSFYIYNNKELEYFEKVLQDIVRVGDSIFANKQDNLKANFERLLQGIQSLIRTPSAEERVSKQEKEMLELIQGRLEGLEDEDESPISTIKKTIGFYLQASTSKEYEAEWIVRDFEQIDGGVLLAATQKNTPSDPSGAKTFHYAGVSDQNLLGKARKELPWPLSSQMYTGFESPIAEICGTCRSEYNHFLRYSLFYGTYFLKDSKNICISYIKEMGDEEANPYSILTNIMGLKVEEHKPSDLTDPWDGDMTYGEQEQLHIMPPAEGSEKRSMETCFMRYLWNHCLDQDTYFSDEFQLERVGKFFIEYNYLQKMKDENKGQQFDQAMFESYTKYLPIFDGTDCKEIEAAIRYKLQQGSGYNDKYIDNVMEFIYRKWSAFNQPVVEVMRRFGEWMGANQQLQERTNCKDCNQKELCYVEIERA